MKLQNLAIIFLVIIIPLIMILSYYLHLQQNTLELQAEYDTKLAEATKEGIKAFEVNTVDWSEWISKKTNQTRRNEAMAAINTFLTSLANNLNISGTAKEYMVNYIPAVAVTMYDGYYIYSPTYAPISIVNSDGVQLYYDKENDELTTESSYGANLPIYKPKAGVMAKQSTYIQTNGIDETIEFVTDITEAETEYKHMLSNYMSYTARYRNNTGTTNVIVNYTLDNRIYVYGKVGGDTVEKDGYLVYFDNTAVMPRINVTATDPKDDSAIQVFKGVKDAKYSNTSIDTEILQEQVLYSQNGSEDLETFKYVYDINHEKLYYDEKEDNFFTIDTSNRERQYISKDTSIKAGDVGCRYKSISVLWGSTDNTTEYKKIYQVLNGKDKGKWYIDIKEDSDDAKDASAEEIDTEIKGTKLKELGLDDPRFSTIYRDYSAISYYVEAYAFTNWARQNLTGVKQEVYNEDLNQYDFKDIEVEGNVVDIFDITVDNDPEKAYSPIVLHKKEITKEHIITNLNLSISNYSRGTYEFKLPVLTNNDWDQVFSNISLITFFQGVPIGLKYYNNYAIATSKTNREYVDPGELYFSGEDPNYHRVYCEKCGNTIYTGYRSVEYVMREYVKRDSNNNIIGTPIYYYLHDRYEGIKNKDSETACYYCIVNKENFVETSDAKIAYTQAKSYNEALARERYYQQEKIIGKLGIQITYDANMEKKGIVENVINVDPHIQEAVPGEKTNLTTQIPTIITNNGWKFIFRGWALDKNASDPDFGIGEDVVFYEDTTLYAVWKLNASSLNWNKDYYWNQSEDNTYAPHPNPQKSISLIKIDSNNNVEMYGNGTYRGKGAAWLNWQYNDINIVKISFDYDINFGDSFTAAGVLLNVQDSNPANNKSGQLNGYMISFNNLSATRNNIFKATGSNASLWNFTYNKGNNSRWMTDDGMTDKNRIQNLNIPKSGHIDIQVTNSGYEIIVNNVTTIPLKINSNSINKNSIGFFTDHYKHSCGSCGYFKISNFDITATMK